MARATKELVEILKRTAQMISDSNQYQWGHMGLCNCGFLAQQITCLQKEEIHSRAMERSGDWNEQLRDYCPTSGLLMDELIARMLGVGLTVDDLKHLENLSDPAVLRRLAQHDRYLRRNEKRHVVLYLTEWARLLEEQLYESITLPEWMEPVQTEV